MVLVRPAAPVRTSVLALLAALLTPVLLATAGPAAAVVQPCTVSYTVAGGPIKAAPVDSDPTDGKEPYVWHPWDIPVEDPRTVIDIDFTIDLVHPDSSRIFAHLIGPRTGPNLAPSIQGVNTNMASGRVDGRYTFDEEVGQATLSGATPPSGTYKPVSEEAGLEGGPGNEPGGWSVWMNNYSTSGGTMRSVTLTLTYATCDIDGDGHEDRADNCPSVANPQTDLDADGFGDECDVDVDADGLLNAADGCARVAAQTTTGCPEVDRTAKLRRKAKTRRLRLAVVADQPVCRARAKATVWHKRGARDKQVKTVTTNRRGKVVFKVKKPGRYYVTVARSYVTGKVECDFDRSRKVRIPRR